MTSPLELLYAALASPIGCAVTVNDFTKAQQRLYIARTKSGDPSLDILQFRRSPLSPETEIWIVKTKAAGEPIPFTSEEPLL